jgi:adenylosuccinate lyase
MSDSPNDTYTSPLATRNASEAMLRIWSPRYKFETWRRIWLAVAEAQHEMGLPVTKEQVEELRANLEVTDEDIALAGKYERELRHDVMAHVHAWGDKCPKARPIIHLGMTSQDINCNADLVTLEQALLLLKDKTTQVVDVLARQSDVHKSLPTLAFTHYQPAQPTTVGRRFAQWAQEMTLCHDELGHRTSQLLFRRRGLRGATGTQASYLALFDGDNSKVDRLEAGLLYELDHKGYELSPWVDDAEMLRRRDAIADHNDQFAQQFQQCDHNAQNPHGTISELRQKAAALRSMNAEQFRIHDARSWTEDRTYILATQTYPRVVDAFILSDLAATAAVLHKIATDIRLLSNRKELDEPFGDKQIGSSAMPYKRNPMRCERICGLTRFVINLVGNAYDTAATQWLERTLDDSSNRRLSLPEAFLALDGSLDLMHNVASGLIVNEAMVKKNLLLELPFMATENILMAAVKAGGDRQDLHERIRVHSQASGHRVKQEGLDNDLIDRLKGDEAFHPPALTHDLDWSDLMDPMKYVGRAPEQVDRFVADVVEPLREMYADELKDLGESEPKV